MREFSIYLKTLEGTIQQEISAAFHTLPKDLPALTSEYQILNESMKGGKCIRGALVQLGYLLTTSEERKEVVKVAAAFEILHASLLIHDDVIDKSFIRRGKPTVHQVMGGNHYGRSQAICLGDTGFFLATECLAKSDFPATVKAKVIALFSRMIIDTIAGEMLDIKISRPDYGKEKDDILLMQQLKTASYSVVGPLIMGAVLGKAKSSQLKAIRHFGECLGMAFQIQDDIMGVFGDERKIGKSVTSDIEENKSTLLIVHALKNATSAQRKILEKYYGRGKITRRQQEKIKEIFISTGSLEYSQAEVKRYVMKSRRFIPGMTTNKKAQVLLNQFAEYIFQRKK